MNSKEIIKNAINFKRSDKIPVDFGATPVSGMHVSCIAQLREYYGLEKSPVKIIDPFQMLGEVDDELKEIIGVDIAVISPMINLFGFENKDWKLWEFENGLEVLVPGEFNTTIDESGNTYIYPEGDLKASPSWKMPKGEFFFDTIIRQEQIDENNLNPEFNLEEFHLISEDEISYLKGVLWSYLIREGLSLQILAERHLGILR